MKGVLAVLTDEGFSGLKKKRKSLAIVLEHAGHVMLLYKGGLGSYMQQVHERLCEGGVDESEMGKNTILN